MYVGVENRMNKDYWNEFKIWIDQTELKFRIGIDQTELELELELNFLRKPELELELKFTLKNLNSTAIPLQFHCNSIQFSSLFHPNFTFNVIFKIITKVSVPIDVLHFRECIIEIV